MTATPTCPPGLPIPVPERNGLSAPVLGGPARRARCVVQR